jgi:two-component system, OmpR family, KDP operon response regulator KdpE
MVMFEDHPPQILVVEDDEDMSELVCTLLESAGYSALAVDCGEDALTEITNHTPSLVLLDLGLPDISGLEILRAVRANSFLPMIILSGENETSEHVIALEDGADDFMGKPFNNEELVARVRALLRRVSWTPKPETKIRVRKLELDMPRRQATIRGKRLHLTPIEYGILVTLMRNSGKIVSHDDLLKAVWGDTYRGDYSVLRVNVSRLRQKLEDNPRRPSYVVTVPGRGYWTPVGRP